MEEIQDTISESHLFGGLADNYLQEIRKITIEKNFKKGETIFFEGDEGNGFYLIINGRVKIYKLSTEGKEKILHIFSKGEPFGEVAMFSGKQFPANAESLAKSRLVFFPRGAFVDLVSRNPSLALNLLAVMAHRLKQFSVQIENLSLKEVPGSLAAHLISLSQEQGNSGTVVLNTTKGQLAGLLGTISETLSRILSKMSSYGLITVKGKEIDIHDFLALEELAQSGRFKEV